MRDDRRNDQAPWWGVAIVLILVLSLILPIWVFIARFLWEWALR